MRDEGVTLHPIVVTAGLWTGVDWRITLAVESLPPPRLERCIACVQSSAWAAPIRAPAPAMPRRPHHSVYVIELAPAVLEQVRFVRANPGYRAGKPCVYVGMTGLDPDIRFDKHKAGIQANRFVQRFGLRLLPEIYAAYNPMTYADARDMEVTLAIDLREGGYGVWQA